MKSQIDSCRALISAIGRERRRVSTLALSSFTSSFGVIWSDSSKARIRASISARRPRFSAT